MTKVYERIIPGYREVHKKRLAGKGPGSYDLAQPNPVEYRSFIGDVRHFAFFLDWFDELGISGPWETHLDLGGAEGNHASLFRALGLSKYSETIDIRPFEKPSRLTRLSFYYRFLFSTRFRLRAKRGIQTGKFGLRLGPRSSYFNMPLIALKSVDKMIVGDIYERTGPFDIITAFLCLEYFDLSKIFEKVSSLLQPDGIFFFIVNYWWYPVNSTEIVGGIPYACQRMTLSELKKHFELHFPGELPDLEERYSYFHRGEILLLP